MTNSPGWTTPGPSDSPEPDDGTGTGPDPSAAYGQPGPAAPADSPNPTEPLPDAGTRPGWSYQQPPPNNTGWARWAPPGDGRPPLPPLPPQQGGPRWGATPQPNGWQQQGPWSLPPAPKPGVIPLRPLNVGEILDGSIAALRRHWRAVLGVTAAIALITQGIEVVVQGLFVDNTSLQKLQDDSHPSAHDVLHAMKGAYAGLGLTSAVIGAGVLTATAMLTVVTGRAVLGRTVTAGDAWRSMRPRLLQLVGLSFLLVLLYAVVLAATLLPGGLIALAGSSNGGAALMALGGCGGVVLVLWLWILLSLAPPAMMLEGQSIVGAMKRSAKLVRGTWWRVLGVELLAFVITGIASAIIELPFSLLSGAVTNDGITSFYSADNNPSWTYLIIAGIGAVIASAITLPVNAGVITLLYMDQRIRRESLDIELTRAAEQG
jgi:hypothetical protein